MNNLMMTNLQLLKTLVRLAQIAEEVEEVNPEAANEIDSFSKDVTSVLPEKLVDDTAPNEGDTINPAMFPPIETPEAPTFDADQDFEDTNPTLDEYTSASEMPEMNEEQIAQLEDRITNEIINSPEFGDLATIFDTPEGQEAMQNLITRKIEENLGNS
jgi:hypothetical protein